MIHFAPPSVIMAGGLLWSSTGMLLASLSGSYILLVCGVALSGLGRAAYHPLAMAMLSRIFGRESIGRAFSLHLRRKPVIVGVVPHRQLFDPWVYPGL